MKDLESVTLEQYNVKILSCLLTSCGGASSCDEAKCFLQITCPGKEVKLIIRTVF